MVTSTAEYQDKQPTPKKKFSVKKLLKLKIKKRNYKEFKTNNSDDVETTKTTSGRSIEVLDLDEQRLLDAEQQNTPQEDSHYDQTESELPLLDSEVPPQARKRVRVHFWRYSKDEVLLENVEDDHEDAISAPRDTAVNKDEESPRKKKKSKKKKAKQVANGFLDSSLKVNRSQDD